MYLLSASYAPKPPLQYWKTDVVPSAQSSHSSKEAEAIINVINLFVSQEN